MPTVLHNGRRYNRNLPLALPMRRMITHVSPNLPPVVDLRPSCGPIKDQGSEGCHDEKTEVLTEAGWILWPEYEGKELLATVNPLTKMMEYQAPTSLVQYDYDGEMHRIEHASLDFSLTPSHRMFLRKWKEFQRTLSSLYEFCKIKDIGWYSGLLSSPVGFRGVTLNSISIGSQKYQGNDFVALISLVASDGWVGGTDSNKNTVSFCCFRDDRREMVAALAYRLGIGEVPSRKGVWRWSSPDLAEWVRANMYVGDCYKAPFKKVPEIIKHTSQKQIERFLAFYGDQCRRDEGRQFYTSSPRMRDDLQELMLKTGRRASFYQDDPKDVVMKDGRKIFAENCQPGFVLTEWTTDRLSVERKKSVYTESYKGPVFCATVPNSTLITRRNSRVLISGNSCTGHAFSSAIEWVFRKYLGKSPVLSPQFFYAEELIQQGNFPQDDGSDGVTGCGVAVSKGCCELALYPYVDGQIVMPTPAQVENALQYAMGAYHGLTGSDVAHSVLADKVPWPIEIGFNVPASFESQQVADTGVMPVPNANDEIIGGHEVLIVGCDLGAVATIRPKGSVPSFLVQNSWGCYSPDTEVLTQAGWKHFPDTVIGEPAATLNPFTHELEYQPILQKFVYPFDGELWNYKARDIDLMVTPNHRMYFKPFHAKNWGIARAENITQRHLQFKKGATWLGVELDSVAIGDYKIDGDLWCEFLGYFLSEGYTYYQEYFRDRSTDGHGKYLEKYYKVGICQNPGPESEKIQKCLSKMPMSFVKEKCGFICASRPLFERLVVFGKAHEKYVPDEIKQASSRQIKIFYQAMTLGDGSEWESCTGIVRTYYTSSPRLADDMQEILLKAGYAGDISSSDRIGREVRNGITRYREMRLGIKHHELQPRAEYVPEKSSYRGEVYCAEVPNHLLYVRRNGRAAWCGNSDWGIKGFFWMPVEVTNDAYTDLKCVHSGKPWV